MSFMFCRHDPNTMAWSAKEILAGVALTMLTGNIISTACSHGAPPVNAKPELEGELLRYTFKGSGPVAHCLGSIASLIIACNLAWSSALHLGSFLAGQYQYLTADGYWGNAKDKEGAKAARRRKVR